MSWFSEITEWAKALEPKWQLAKSNQEEFCDFAFREMQQQTFHKNFHLQNNLKEILEAQKYPIQANPLSVFGDPPITLHIAEDRFFYLDLYIWMETQTTIHQHVFEGAFTVLQGHSIESDYEFIPSTAIGTSYWGKLQKKDLRRLNPGDIRPIHFKDKMVHRVLHISKPTVSLVLRTSRPPSTDIQYNYDFNQLASNGHLPGDVVAKMRALTWFLKDGNVPTYKMVESILPYSEAWNLLGNYQQSSVLLQKMALLHKGPTILTEMMEQKLFIRIFQSLSSEEEKVLFTAYDFFKADWTSWVEKNYLISPETSQEKLQLAIKSLPWVEDKHLQSSLLKLLFNPKLASETI